MQPNPLNHIDLRVRDLDAALPLYRVLMPALGFGEGGAVKETDGTRWAYSSVKRASGPPGQFFGLTENPHHTANQTCIAFYVERREDVDRLAEAVIDAGARNVEGPCECPEYGNGYYAVFFEDASRNRLEIHTRE